MSIPMVVIAALIAIAVPAAPAAAKQKSAVREFVLKQIDLPHHYYYREMYLPQVTSGPNAVSWSPDGQELVYALQGTLWRQRIGSTEARQITDGPGYDHQPDWSPDGRSIVYASYHDDAVELWLLDLASGRSTPITSGGAVNVEPRWSRDGRRIAFVSTLYNRRFHVHVADIEAGTVRGIARLTEDHDSGLPRYYYSPFDHYLSPTWSPDGRDIILVSNRDRIQGTGGFWRMAARPGSRLRPVHYEETAWRARPDWAPDGKRVVYASFAGRQWHNLWLMTADGGDAFPLTYGEYDMTGPRWSPDGRRIACISNQDGNTSLWVIEVPGGRRTRIEARRRAHLAPVGRLKLTVVDRATGRTVPARLTVTGPDGRTFAPDDAWRHADEAFDRSQSKYEASYFHTAGSAEITVPAGPVTIEALRGLEYRPARLQVEVPRDGTRAARVVLERIADLKSQGWWGGDLHVHMNYGGHYRNTPERLALQARAEGLHTIENLVVNKEQRIPDIDMVADRPAPPWTKGAVIAHGQEFHTSFWGHTALIGLGDHYLLPDYAAYVKTAAASLFPHNPAVFEMARAQGAITGYVHPFDVVPDPADRATRLTHDLPVGVALGRTDYFEVVGFSDHLATSTVWYRLLNCGFRLPAGAGTDAMANYASLRGPVGVDRVYVRAGRAADGGAGAGAHAGAGAGAAGPSRRAWLDAIRAGRTFATNGPLLEFSIDGRGIGDEIRLPAAGGTLVARVNVRSIAPLTRVEIVGNGEVIASLPIDAAATGGATASGTVRLEVKRSGWYLVRAWNDRPASPILDIYPFGTTSPIYVTVGDAPVRNPADAAYFIAWIDRLEEAALAHTGWNSEDEKLAVRQDLGVARALFRERSGG
jgi:Tol biopolymer transport system component